MRYKAKESYFKLKDDENLCINKHKHLMLGLSVEITSLPKALEKHLEIAEPKKKSKMEYQKLMIDIINEYDPPKELIKNYFEN